MGRQQPALTTMKKCPSVQTAFAKQVTALVSCFEEMGNPFMKTASTFLPLTPKMSRCDEVVHAVWTVLDHGQEQYMTFIEECFEKRTKLLPDPIKSNKLPLFSNQVRRPPPSVKNLAMQKNDCSLFLRLYIACQTREGNLEEFFKHENQP